MCTFNGIISEYPWISVDSFVQHNRETSRTYFISHIHTDHLRGLNDVKFAEYLSNNRSVRVYCSQPSKHFLTTLPAYKHLSQYLFVINVDQPFAIQDPYDENVSVTITSFGSGHCPGSLMFFFEGYNGTVLYTGDFRLYSHQSIRHHNILSTKTINKLYIDMTFFDPSIRYLPEREQSCEKLIELIKINPNKNFYLQTSARVGYEYVFMTLYQHFGLLIHVNSEQYHLYDCLPQVQQTLTINQDQTKLHACWPKCSKTKCSTKIVLSVLWFTYQQYHQFTSPLVQLSPNYYRLCYSLHSSFNEICQFLKKISPNHIHPIAVPIHMTSQKLNELLQQLGLNKSEAINFTPSNTSLSLQIKQRYPIQENHPDDNWNIDDDLEFDCHSNQINNEEQLYKRIINLQQSLNKTPSFK